MQIRTIKKNSISDQVLQQMQEMIERKEWQEGSRIPSEAQLTEMFGVSRISVRDAIKQLVGLGMLESKQGSGTYVRSSDSNLPLSIRNLTVQKKQDLLELLEFRKAIEVILNFFQFIPIQSHNFSLHKTDNMPPSFLIMV